MPPKKVFDKERIIKAALKIASEKGLQSITAREVAKRMNSSTAPVYSTFGSIEQLKSDVVKMGLKILSEYQKKEYTESVFRNMGIGYVLFARDHSELFRTMYLEKGNHLIQLLEHLNSLSNELEKIERFAEFESSVRFEILQKMWVYSHGLAAFASVGLFEFNDVEELSKNLFDVGSAVIENYSKNINK